MDEPARKRRKTASPEAEGRASSPLKKPPRRMSLASYSITGAERQSSPLKEPPRRPSASPTKGGFGRSASPLKQLPRRPSFASPTKASLARNYPNLLRERPSSSGPGASNPDEPGGTLARDKQVRAFVSGDEDAEESQSGQRTIGNREESPTIAGAQQLHAYDSQRTTPQPRRNIAREKATAVSDASDEEPDLPTTPSQRTAEEQDTPRRGILFSSPSKRPPRLKDPVKRSPLRPKAPPVHVEQSEVILDGPSENELDYNADEKEKQPPDPELQKRKQEKENLLRELKELESQISQCTEEIVKIQGQPSTQLLEPAERENLVAFINKISEPDAASEEEHAPAISSLLCSFLPFSTRSLPPPKSRQAQQKPVASHLPLELDDPLPYLEMFTSFQMTTQISLPRARVSPNSNRVHQQHVIDIIGPQKLLTTSLSIVIDTPTNTVIDLKVLRLPSWADRELGTFMRARAQEKDLSNACWALGSYWEIAKKRAEYWHKCETSFGRLIPGWTSHDRENVAKGGNSKGITRKDLNRHLGRDLLVLEDRHVMLKIKWDIKFDWTGEAESQISVEPAVPQVWTEADSTNSFKKIPETFNSLVQAKGVFAATKTMVALLFAE